ncbi:MmcQ-like protein [Sphingobacteriaceae bacterium]|nr:MmcQ-like protein [Sphingobacteriaceae bacterium]
MNAEEIREICLSKKGVEEGFPFGNETLVFKVGGKIFLLVSLESQILQFNAKCMPDRAIELREKFSTILPGYHMNKKHWNTVICDGSIPKVLINTIIEDSYQLVLSSLTKKIRAEFAL